MIASPYATSLTPRLPQSIPLEDIKEATSAGKQIIHNPQLSQDNYPRIKYWVRKDWTEANTKTSGISKARGKPITKTDDKDKGNSEDENKYGDEESEARWQQKQPQRGGTQCAKGVNVAMRYVEHENGKPVNGTVAASMRKHARSLWVLFAMEGRAPASWVWSMPQHAPIITMICVQSSPN